MEKSELLRGIVARLGQTEPGKIGPDFPLNTRGLQGSVRRAALAAAIRRQLGTSCPAAYSAANFGELERAVLGNGARTDSAAACEAPISTASPFPILGNDAAAEEVHCGMDIKPVAQLPEAADYREHEFYRTTFTPEETAYCLLQESPRMHFAARWCAKEALQKCDPAFDAEKARNVEVARADAGGIYLRERGNGAVTRLPHAVSISHTNTLAAAVVVRVAAGSPQSAAEPENSAPVDSPAAGRSPADDLLMGLKALAWLAVLGAAFYALARTFR